MSYAADLHVHSPFARGTSRRIDFEGLARWARAKGIGLLATADFTHPTWLDITRDSLRDSGDGLLELDGVSFVLGTEVNCSAPQAGRNRRVHLLVFAPGFKAVESINASLAGRGTLSGDGRPTLRLTPRELVHLLADIDPRCFVIPAHIWTPWFGLYGSKSGFDSLEECFGDALDGVPAVESGLSSDPTMNWRVPSLDGVSIVSFSDAHSLPKMGRELTVLSGRPSYDGLVAALRSQSIEYTVEFFPEEGKYHHSGHRKCGVRMSPDEVAAGGGVCPNCGRKVTLGVMQRVEELARRPVVGDRGGDGLVRGDNGRPPFRNLIGLAQVLSEALRRGSGTRTVRMAYDELVSGFGSELAVLVDVRPADIAAVAGERASEGILRVRAGDISIEPGYDGQYGSVRVWPDS